MYYMSNKDDFFAVRLTEEQKRKLEAIAQHMRRTQSDAMRIMIEDKYTEISGVSESPVKVPA